MTGMRRSSYNSRSLMQAIKEASGPPRTHRGMGAATSPLNLREHKVNLHIVKVGGVVEEPQSCGYELCLIDNANAVVTISILGVHHIQYLQTSLQSK